MPVFKRAEMISDTDEGLTTHAQNRGMPKAGDQRAQLLT
jgi:hypothetical protein